jgi:hypothetical protein
MLPPYIRPLPQSPRPAGVPLIVRRLAAPGRRSDWPVSSPRRPSWKPDQQKGCNPYVRKPTAPGMSGWICSPRSSWLRSERSARPMPETRLPPPVDSGHAQLSLFGPGEPESMPPPASGPSGPCAADNHLPVRLAAGSSAAQSAAPPHFCFRRTSIRTTWPGWRKYASYSTGCRRTGAARQRLHPV